MKATPPDLPMDREAVLTRMKIALEAELGIRYAGMPGTGYIPDASIANAASFGSSG
jgi:hypothetical protein